MANPIGPTGPISTKPTGSTPAASGGGSSSSASRLEGGREVRLLSAESGGGSGGSAASVHRAASRALSSSGFGGGRSREDLSTMGSLSPTSIHTVASSGSLGSRSASPTPLVMKLTLRNGESDVSVAALPSTALDQRTYQGKLAGLFRKPGAKLSVPMSESYDGIKGSGSMLDKTGAIKQVVKDWKRDTGIVIEDKKMPTKAEFDAEYSRVNEERNPTEEEYENFVETWLNTQLASVTDEDEKLRILNGLQQSILAQVTSVTGAVFNRNFAVDGEERDFYSDSLVSIVTEGEKRAPTDEELQRIVEGDMQAFLSGGRTLVRGVKNTDVTSKYTITVSNVGDGSTTISGSVDIAIRDDLKALAKEKTKPAAERKFKEEFMFRFSAAMVIDNVRTGHSQVVITRAPAVPAT